MDGKGLDVAILDWLFKNRSGRAPGPTDLGLDVTDEDISRRCRSLHRQGLINGEFIPNFDDPEGSVVSASLTPEGNKLVRRD